MRQPRVLFLGSLFAGHRTRFLNLQRHTHADPRIRPTYRSVSGWVEGGLVERILPPHAAGLARVALEIAPIAALPRPDVIWTPVSRGFILPYFWSQLGPFRRPLVLDLDWTYEQQEELAPFYFDRPPRQGLAYSSRRFWERLAWQRVSVFTPWSNWAAASLRRQGVPAERIRVLPPGVDLEQWRPRPEARGSAGGPLRLLFVGGDFARKGGPLLLDAMRGPFAGRCELDVVTRDAVEPAPGVRVHRATPNSPLLHGLYARADLFVLPTRAEAFGIATVEAMACGLPVIVGDVGGAPDIVEQGVTGWRIPPTTDGLTAALERALAERDRLPAMGQRGRSVAEARFDERRNARRVVDLLLELAEPRGCGSRQARLAGD